MYGEVYQFQHFQLHIFHQAAVSECLDICIQICAAILLPLRAHRKSRGIISLFL